MASAQTMTLQPPPTTTTTIPSSTPSSSSFLEYAKSCGRCTPSLLPTESEFNIDQSFYGFVSKLVDLSVQGVALKNSTNSGKEFENAVKMVQSFTTLTVGHDIESKAKILAKRRAILLLIVQCTSGDNEALQYILNNGFLVDVKAWLDDILAFKIGGVDLLLHLLNSICMLPVTKIMVTSSKLGKQVAAVEKHKICITGMNQKAIKDRVARVKEEWSASVKRMKKKSASATTNKKRPLDNDHDLQPVKKMKNESSSKSASSLSNLIQQVSSNTASATKSIDHVAETNIKPTKPHSSVAIGKEAAVSNGKTNKKSKKRRIRWADSEGLPISVSHKVERHEDSKSRIEKKESSKDRKKRDRLKEKDLMQKARKSKLIDKDDSLDTMAIIFSSKWHRPSPLPADSENPPVHVNSLEKETQTKRIASVMPVNFLSEDDVPSNPYPLTENEQTNDFNAQAATTPQIIPFFYGQQTHAPTPTSIPAPPPPPPLPTTAPPIPPPPPILPPIPTPTNNLSHTAASIDTVRSMGLPDFLAGQNIQALQALVASPGLLNTFVDVNGNYDQMKVMNLIQAMNLQLQKLNPNTSNQVRPIPPPPQPTTFDHFKTTSLYNQIPQASAYNPPSKPTTTTGYRGDQNNTDGNLHLSGYNPATPIDSIIALFAPYVKVDEVVPKSGFMFLNTSDPEGAKRAREALNGVMVGGSPLRINVALRRNKNPANAIPPNQSVALLPRNALGQIDFDAVRDDRGNPATRNLFVAGYGHGTTEQQLREVFSQQTTVTGVVMKGTFSFINTTERSAAVLARQALIGTNVNGGNIRINFAKDSGRTNIDPSKGTFNNTYYGSTTFQ